MEEAERLAAAAVDDDDEPGEVGGDNSKKINNKNKKKKKSIAQRKANAKKPQTGSGDLTSKVFATMEKHKEVFFTIRLHSAQSAASLNPIQDPDPLMPCDLMDGRDAFLTMARERHLEFSSLRRVKFSTMALLYELHTQGQDKFVYTCNSCQKNVENRYHCTVCEDFDLCVDCFKKDNHPHKMEKQGSIFGSSEGSDSEGGANAGSSRTISIQRCIQSLVHACQCRDANCQLPSCRKMKRIVAHTKSCKRKTNGGCPICKQLIALCCYHAKACNEPKCPVPFCVNIKQKMPVQILNPVVSVPDKSIVNHMHGIEIVTVYFSITKSKEPHHLAGLHQFRQKAAVGGGAGGRQDRRALQREYNPDKHCGYRSCIVRNELIVFSANRCACESYFSGMRSIWEMHKCYRQWEVCVSQEAV